METKFTPGPWNTKRTAVYDTIRDSEDRLIAFVAIREPEEAKANIDLMRAAPDLLSALNEIVEFCLDPNGSEKSESLASGLARMLPNARAAISKATGQ